MRRRPILGALAAGGLAVALMLPASAAPTDARFVDTEVAQATMTAFRLAPPRITSATCNVSLLNILAANFAVNWQPPTVGLPTGSVVQWSVAGSTWAEQSAATTGPTNGTYTTTFGSGLLNTLLGSALGTLLGSDFTVQTRAAIPGTNWVSSVSTLTISPGLLSSTCNQIVNGT